jgi:hypothetical protein
MATTKTKKSTSKKPSQSKRIPRPKGTKATILPGDQKEARRQFTQVKRWLHGSRPHRPVPLQWHDDAKLDQYEGRDGGDILVVLTPHQNTRLPPKLVQKAYAKLRRTTLLMLKRPPKDSGLQIYDARIHGLSHLSNCGSVLYQLTAKDVDDAKNQLAEVVVKLRLQMADGLLHQLTNQMKRPPEAVLHMALLELHKQKNPTYCAEARPGPSHCRIKM